MVPVAVLAAAIPGITLPEMRWMMPGVAQQMRYESSDIMARIRKLGAMPKIDATTAGAADEIRSLASDHADVAAALVLLGGAAAADEAHNLVTPLSWPHATAFGGGARPDGPAAHEATYAHALIHRMEAHHPGEFGTGFHNSDFWFSALGDHVVFPKVRDVAIRLSRDPPAATCKLVQRFAMESLMDRWAPKAFNGLLAQAASTPDDALRGYCEQVATAELRLLLEHCLEMCACAAAADVFPANLLPDSCGPAARGMSEEVEAALDAARRVSEAHVDGFRDQGLVAVRGPLDGNPGDHQTLLVCAAVAARLLGAERVWRADARAPGEAGAVDVLHLDDEGEIAVAGREVPVTRGDVLAVAADRGHQVGAHIRTLRFQARPPSEDPGAEPTWVDRLFESRGRTPTTVVQWSKGPPAPERPE